MCFCKNIILNVMVVCPWVGFASEFIFMCVLLNMCSCVIVCVCVLPRAGKLCGHRVVAVWGPCGPALDLLNQLSRENGKYFGARSCYNYNLCF